MDLNKNIIKDIEKILGEIYVNPIDNDYIEDILEKLISAYEELKDKYEELKQDLKDNFKPIPVSEQFEISDRDFI